MTLFTNRIAAFLEPQFPDMDTAVIHEDLSVELFRGEEQGFGLRDLNYEPYKPSASPLRAYRTYNLDRIKKEIQRLENEKYDYSLANHLRLYIELIELREKVNVQSHSREDILKVASRASAAEYSTLSMKLMDFTRNTTGEDLKRFLDEKIYNFFG